MATEALLTDTILFEVAGRLQARLFCDHLQSRWIARVLDDGDDSLVAVELRPEEGDLAVLLWTGKLLAAAFELDRLGVHVDGRAYALEPGGPVSSGAAA